LQRNASRYHADVSKTLGQAHTKKATYGASANDTYFGESFLSHGSQCLSF
jgi:hypothetical protein